jgi:hypothetical protein
MRVAIRQILGRGVLPDALGRLVMQSELKWGTL